MGNEKPWFKSYPEGVPHEVDFEKITMPEALAKTTTDFPNLVAIIYMGKKITYRQLDGMVNQFARALLELGVKKGDKIAIVLPNVPQAVITTYAAFRIGAVPVVNNPLFTDRELEYQLNDCDAELLVVLDLLLARAINLKNKTKIRTIVACHLNDYLPFPKKQLFPRVKKDLYRAIPTQPDVHAFLELMAKFSDAPVENLAEWDDLAAFIYTGGTTGAAKGVMLTHANISSNVQQMAAFARIPRGTQAYLGLVPFFHASGFTGIMHTCIWNGRTQILLPRPDVEQIVDMLAKYKPNYLPGVPTLFVALLNNQKFQSLDLSHMYGFMSGAAPLSVDTIQQLKNAAPNAHVLEVYGMTETTPYVTMSPRDGNVKPATVGLPMPSTDVKIVDLETGEKEVETGSPGEIVIKGPQITLGYYKKPGETATAIRNGWLFSGDIGFFDEDGHLTIVDRKKEVILAGEWRVYPREIDEVLYANPKVLEACAIGVPHAERGEYVKAYVVAKPDQTLTQDEIADWCKERLAEYKLPEKYEFIDALPKSHVGKILRREVKEMDQKLASAQ